MTPELLAFVRDLAAVIEKHKGGLTYTINDDGIHAYIGDLWSKRARLGFVSDGKIQNIERLLNNKPE